MSAVRTDPPPPIADMVPDHMLPLSPAEQAFFTNVDAGKPSIFAADIPADQREIRGECIAWLLSDTALADRISPHGLALSQAVIAGDTVFTSAAIPSPLLFQTCVFKGQLQFNSCRMPGIQIVGGSTLNGVVLNDTDVSNQVVIGDGSFASNVLLSRVAIQGNLDMRGLTLGSPPKADAQTARVLTCILLDVGGSVLLSHGFKAHGECQLTDAVIANELNCNGGAFLNRGRIALKADGMRASRVHLTGPFQADGQVVFKGATISGLFRLLHDPMPADLTPTYDLRNATVRTLSDNAASWPGQDRLLIANFAYENIDALGSTRASERLNWLSRQPRTSESIPAYAQLAATLQDMGFNDDADAIRYEKSWLELRHSDPGFFRHATRRFLGVTVGFGYRPWQGAIDLLGLVVLGAMLAYVGFRCGVIVPRQETAEQKPPPFRAWQYAVAWVTPVGYLANTFQSWTAEAMHNSARQYEITRRPLLLNLITRILHYLYWCLGLALIFALALCVSGVLPRT